MIHKRIGGMFRDAWYLLIVVLVASVVMWIVLAPLVGIATLVLSVGGFAYFGIVRYDDEGNERTDTRA